MTTARRPQDRKPKAQKGDYTYAFSEDKSFTIPSLNSLMTFGFSRTHRDLSPEEQIYLLLEDEDNVPADTLAVIDAMDREETAEFVKGWQEHSGIDTGE